MDRNTTLAFVLIGLVLVVWLFMNAPEPQKPTKVPADSTLTKDTSKIPAQEEVKKEEAKNEVDNETNTGPFASTNEPEKVITIETDLALYELTTKGGKIKRCYLKEYETWYHEKFPEDDFKNTHVQLVNTKAEGGDFNLVFVSTEGKFVNTKELDFKADSRNNFKLTGKDSAKISFVFETPQKNIIKKNFTFFANNYMSNVDVEFVNMDSVISSYRYDVEWSNGINFVEENSVDESTYSNAIAFSGDEKVVIDATSADEPEKKNINGKVDWLSIRNKYFAVIISPDKPKEEGGADFKGERKYSVRGEKEVYRASLKVPFSNSDYQKDSYKLYLGPVNYDILKGYNKNFETIFDFGNFLGLRVIITPISEYILLPLFKFLHIFIPNYGFVIIIFSLIIKIVLYPLTKQSMKSMRKMQLLQPMMKELKEKYKDDPARVQKETMKLYSTYGINPAGGCLPMLLQMPILVALFTFFNVAIEIRHEPFIFWITNLSSPDVIFTLPFKIPLFNVDKVSGLAPLLGITMFFQQKMSVKDPSQKALVYMMPVMFTLMFMNFSSGLNLYYFMFNVFSIAQQYYVTHKKGDDKLEPVANPKKKGGFMQRMMEAAEKQQTAQKQNQREAVKNRRKKL
ncbi:MAG: membrane protein insertase YidC [bacterium]